MIYEWHVKWEYPPVPGAHRKDYLYRSRSFPDTLQGKARAEDLHLALFFVKGIISLKLHRRVRPPKRKENGLSESAARASAVRRKDRLRKTFDLVRSLSTWPGRDDGLFERCSEIRSALRSDRLEVPPAAPSRAEATAALWRTTRLLQSLDKMSKTGL